MNTQTLTGKRTSETFSETELDLIVGGGSATGKRMHGPFRVNTTASGKEEHYYTISLENATVASIRQEQLN